VVGSALLFMGYLTDLEFEEFAEAFGLLAGDGDFGRFFVVHF
jgi:hypothetical protein